MNAYNCMYLLKNSPLLQDDEEMDRNIWQYIIILVCHIHIVENEHLGDCFKIGLKN